MQRHFPCFLVAVKVMLLCNINSIDRVGVRIIVCNRTKNTQQLKMWDRCLGRIFTLNELVELVWVNLWSYVSHVVRIVLEVGHVHFYQLWYTVQKDNEEWVDFELFECKLARSLLARVRGTKKGVYCFCPLVTLGYNDWLVSRFGFKDLILAYEIVTVVVPFFMYKGAKSFECPVERV